MYFQILDNLFIKNMYKTLCWKILLSRVKIYGRKQSLNVFVIQWFVVKHVLLLIYIFFQVTHIFYVLTWVTDVNIVEINHKIKLMKRKFFKRDLFLDDKYCLCVATSYNDGWWRLIMFGRFLKLIIWLLCLVVGFCNKKLIWFKSFN